MNFCKLENIEFHFIVSKAPVSVSEHDLFEGIQFNSNQIIFNKTLMGAEYQLFSINGQLEKRGVINSILSISDLTNGSHVLQIFHERRVSSKVFIKE